MRLDKKFKLEKAVCRDGDMRPVLTGVFVENEKAIATNGRILAIVPVSDTEEDQLGDGAIIPIAALKESRKLHKTEQTPPVKINGTVSLTDGRTFSKIEGKYPAYGQVIPTAKQKGIRIVRFNPKLLMDLAESIGWQKGEGVILEIPENPNNPIRVTTAKSPGALGVLMPMRA